MISHTRTHILITIVSTASAVLVTAAMHFPFFSASLVVNTNMQSINAHNKLTMTQTSLTKVFERISSGLRINKAADDAAGLGVSQSLDEEVRSLRQASRNVNDGVSLVQTAEGAANEIGNILKRMRELALQGENRTLGAEDDDDEDRWTELYDAGDELALAVDTLQFSGTVSDTAGTTLSPVILAAQKQYVARMETIAEAIDEALTEEDDVLLQDLLEKAQQVLAIAQKEVTKTAEAVAKSAGQSAKTAERKLQDIERKSVVKPAAGARSAASKTKAQKSLTSSSVAKKR